MNNLEWGLQISALGMGLVFGLLALLWGLLVLALRLDAPAATVPGAARAADEAAAVPLPAEPAAPALEPTLVAAITTAVLVHCAVRRGEASPAMRSHWPGSLLHASRWVASGRLRQNRTFRKGR